MIEPSTLSDTDVFPLSLSQAYELSTLTGTQVLLLVASETGHVYTFATRKLQPMITSETGKALIQTCLNSPDSPPRSDPSTDQRMSATGFEETDLTYQVSESESMGDTKVRTKRELNICYHLNHKYSAQLLSDKHSLFALLQL